MSVKIILSLQEKMKTGENEDKTISQTEYFMKNIRGQYPCRKVLEGGKFGPWIYPVGWTTEQRGEFLKQHGEQ